MELFKLVGSIFVNNSEANDQIDQTTEKAESAGSKFKDGIGTVAKWGGAVVGGAAAAGAALVGFATESASTADHIDKMSQKIGLSREAYQELDFICSQSGTTVDGLQAGMKSLTAAMDGAKSGTAANVEQFERLGVAVTNSDGTFRSQEDVLFDTISALQGMEDQTEKARLASELFGRSGTELMPLLNGQAGSMEEMRNQAHELGLVLGDDLIDDGVALTDSLDQTKRAFKSMGTQLGGSLMPIVTKVSEWIQGYLPTIQGMVERIAPVITTLLDGILPPLMDLGDTLLPVIFDLIEQLLPPVTQIISTVLPIIVQLIQMLLPPIVQIVSAVLPPLVQMIAALLPLLQPLLALLQPFIDLLLILLQPLIDLLNQILPPLTDFITKIVEQMTGELQPIIEAIATLLGDVLGPAFELVGQIVKLVVQVITGDFEGAKETLTGIWNTIKETASRVWNAIKEKAQELWDKIKEHVIEPVREAFEKVREKFENIKSTIQEKIEYARDKVRDAVEKLKSHIIDPITDAYRNVKEKFDNIKNTIKEKIEWARDKVRDAIEKIKGFFDFKWELPKIKLPHFSITGKFSLSPPQIPKLTVEWYKKAMDDGMIMDQPTIFGYDHATNRLLAGGEAGSETVVGTDNLMTMIQAATAEQNNSLADVITDLFERLFALLETYFPEFAAVKELAFDGDEFVLRTVGKYNKALERLRLKEARG